jgi:hypothetical protein
LIKEQIVAVLTREEKSAKIMELEIEASKLVQQAGGKILGSNLFPKYLKLVRKIAKIRNSL